MQKIRERLNRQSAKKQGFYDGRFRTRAVKDKKKSEYLKKRKHEDFDNGRE